MIRLIEILKFYFKLYANNNPDRFFEQLRAAISIVIKYKTTVCLKLHLTKISECDNFKCAFALWQATKLSKIRLSFFQKCSFSFLRLLA
jgi:hypothetical protein